MFSLKHFRLQFLIYVTFPLLFTRALRCLHTFREFFALLFLIMPRSFTTFNAFVFCELLKVRTEFPGLSPNKVYQLAVRRWFFRGRFRPAKLLNRSCGIISVTYSQEFSTSLWMRCDVRSCDRWSSGPHSHKLYWMIPTFDRLILDENYLFNLPEVPQHSPIDYDKEKFLRVFFVSFFPADFSRLPNYSFRNLSYTRRVQFYFWKLMFFFLFSFSPHVTVALFATNYHYVISNISSRYNLLILALFFYFCNNFSSIVFSSIIYSCYIPLYRLVFYFYLYFNFLNRFGCYFGLGLSM